LQLLSLAVVAVAVAVADVSVPHASYGFLFFNFYDVLMDIFVT